jgi:hypothetical protein
MYGLKAGTLVKARRMLDKGGANVERGTLGVVFEPTVYVLNACTFNEAGPAHGGHVMYGPQVRWVTGCTCNVYPGDVAHVTGSEIGKRLPLPEADALLSERAPSRHGRVAVRAWVWGRMHAEDVARENGTRPYFNR